MKIATAAAAIAFTLTGVAHAAVSSACHTIRLANIGWTDNEVQNAVFRTIAQDLGYTVKTTLYSEEVAYRGLKNGQIDVFLDDWTPSMNKITAPYRKSHSIDVIGPDLTGAKYTLVVPTYLYKKGLTTFSDIHKFAKQLHHKIYGIEPGNDGNEHILSMIKHNKFDLGNFHLVQSSEAGMLAEVSRKYKKHKPIVFLGWEPEPMNVEFNIKYLSGGKAYFGPHKGEATIYINTRAGYSKDCPNVGRLLHHFRLTVQNENKMMYKVQVKNDKPNAVAAAWIKDHQNWLAKMLKGVTTVDGKPGLPAVSKKLNIG